MQQPYNYMIVDDEQEAIGYLESLVQENCPELQLVATANTSEDAKKAYFKSLPDLIFMDIEVDNQTGFDILKEIYREKLKPHIVFVTAFNHYAIDAFKANAIGYLLKPVDGEDVKNVVKKFKDDKQKDFHYEKIKAMLVKQPDKIRFNTRTGFILLHTNDILYCEADRNYTRIHKTYDSFEMISYNLAEVEKKLEGNGFWRINRSYLVNSEYVLGLDRKQKKCFLRCKNHEIELPASPKMIKNL